MASNTLAGLPKAVNKQVGRVYQPVAHPLTKLLSRRINPLTTCMSFWSSYFYHAIIWGNAYGLIQRKPGTLQAAAIHLLDPEKVTPFLFEGQPWYWVRDAKGPNRLDAISASDVVHLKGLGFDSLQGYPLVSMLATTFGWAMDTQNFSARYFRSGTHVQGSVEIPTPITPEQSEALAAAIRRKHAGQTTDYDFLILGAGAKLNNSTITPEDSQLIETSEATNYAIARVLGVNPIHLYEYGRATWANSEVKVIDSLKSDLRPWIESAEEEIESKLLSDAEMDAGLIVRFDLEDLIRGDAGAISLQTIAEVNAGLRTANEGRSRLGLAPVADPKADELRVPVNFPIAGQPVAAPAPAAPPAKQSNAAPADAARLQLSAMKPVLDDACARVDAKTDKAFANHVAKAKPELTIWANVFAVQQGQFVRDALTPIHSIVPLPVDKAVEHYTAAVRRRAATGESRPLLQIIQDLLTETP